MEKTKRASLCISLPAETKERIDKAAEKTGLKKSTIVTQGIDLRLLEIEGEG